MYWKIFCCTGSTGAGVSGAAALGCWMRGAAARLRGSGQRGQLGRFWAAPASLEVNQSPGGYQQNSRQYREQQQGAAQATHEGVPKLC